VHLLPSSLSKSLRVTEFISLASHRPAFRYFAEILFRRVMTGLEESQLEFGDISESLSGLPKVPRAYLTWLLPIFLKSQLTTGALSSFLTSKVLGPSPSTSDVWRALQLISLLLSERNTKKGSQNFIPLQNFLMNVKAGLYCNTEKTNGGEGVDIVTMAEELLRLS
jgi:hypothetical protein